MSSPKYLMLREWIDGFCYHKTLKKRDYCKITAFFYYKYFLTSAPM